MSLVSNLTSMIMNTRMASDAEFGIMNTSNRIMNRVAQAGNIGFGANLKQIHDQENKDMLHLQNLNLMRKIAEAREEADKKRLDYYA